MTTAPTERSVPKPVFTDAEAGRQGVPGLERPQVQLLHPAEAQADPLRGRDRRGPAGPAALPQPGLAATGSPTAAAATRWTGPSLKAWGSDRPEPERFPGSGGKGYDWPALGWHEFRDPNEEWELTLYRYNSNVGAAGHPEHRGRPAGQGVRAVEPELGPSSSSATSARGCTSTTASACTCTPTPTAGRRPTCTTTRSR